MRKNKKQKQKIKREKIRNRKLIKKYPWLKPRNVWTGKLIEDYDYSWIEWYGWPQGWNIAFGTMYLKEFGEAVKKAGLEHKMIIEQQKEKYGQCRNYVYPTTEEIEEIINKYEKISENVCCICGQPDVPMINDGWFSPYCFSCFKKNWRQREEYISKRDENHGASTDEEIFASYNKCVCDSDPKIDNSYSVTRFSKNGNKTTTYDISETAEKIRKRWYKKHKMIHDERK